MFNTRSGVTALFLAIFAGSVLIVGPAFAKRTQYVQVRNAKIRAEPKNFSRVLTSLQYRDAVDELESKDGWLKVTAKGKTGYLHETAVTTKRIVASSKTMSPMASESDVVLAGKGFSEDVESQYQKQNPNKRAQYSKLDQLESTYRNWNPSIMSFRKSGKLREGEG